jgi:L-seryl-tRNA(Ser) seleniumtransferase
VENIQKILSQLPSVDELLKGPYGQKWLDVYPRRTVIKAIRVVLDKKRETILKDPAIKVSSDTLAFDIEQIIKSLSAYKLKPLINATGIIIHTNLGRAILSPKAIDNIRDVAGNYTNLEYEISLGKRGKRYLHIRDILKELSGAEEAVVVNNNAAAVVLCLNTFAKNREVIVSRGELVEIGGSFRIPEVMESSGALLKDVGTTNKTHFSDYKNALSGNTALLLRIHQSNYKIIGFTEEVSLDELIHLGREFDIPVMADLGSGCMINMEKYEIKGEPTVQQVLETGVDLVTFSGDKLLGGPQSGIILGKEKLVEKIQKNPLLRAMRIDKLTLASLEATLMQYLDTEKAVSEIPTLRMLTQSPDIIKKRAKKLYINLHKILADKASISVTADRSQAGGGALPETDLPTFVVSIKPQGISINALEKKLRLGNPPVIARIKENTLILDARTVQEKEVKTLSACIISALS